MYFGVSVKTKFAGKPDFSMNKRKDEINKNKFKKEKKRWQRCSL